jgi:hypothetical protein
MVERMGKGVKTNPNDLIENEQFKGSENPLIFEHFYDLDLRCNFDLLLYPFDKPLCTLDVSNISHLYFFG